MLPEQDGLVNSQGYDIIGVCKTWWNESHGWSTGMEGYRLFRSRTEQVRWRNCCVREGGFDCTALTVSDDVTESP